MIIEFDRPLIFFKTRKTGSTSVEAALEATLWGRSPDHGKQASIYGNGFVTGRPRNFRSLKRQLSGLPKMVMYFGRYGCRPAESASFARLRPHDPPEKIMAMVPSGVWERAHKIAVVRNPWDKVVSDFFWESRGTNLAADLTTAFEAYVSRSLPWPVEEQVPRLLDPTWTLLRFETLERDFCRLTQALGLGEHRSLLPQFKSNVRPPGTDYRDVHTAFTREVVAVNWSDWIQTFDYSFGEKLP